MKTETTLVEINEMKIHKMLVIEEGSVSLEKVLKIQVTVTEYKLVDISVCWSSQAEQKKIG